MVSLGLSRVATSSEVIAASGSPERYWRTASTYRSTPTGGLTGLDSSGWVCWAQLVPMKHVMSGKMTTGAKRRGRAKRITVRASWWSRTCAPRAGEGGARGPYDRHNYSRHNANPQPRLSSGGIAVDPFSNGFYYRTNA